MLGFLYTVTTIFENKKKQDSLKSDVIYSKNSLNDEQYIKIFWVGLIDGDGQHQVDNIERGTSHYNIDLL